MESLQVRTGQISLKILDDAGNERGIFRFNPEDIDSARKIIGIQDKMKERENDMLERAKGCDNPADQINLLNEAVTSIEDMIDECFGAGSSQILFGNCKTLSMFDDFFSGITPYYQKASKARMQKYKKTSGK